MEQFTFKYTGKEAVEMAKDFFPSDWKKRLEEKKSMLIRLSKTHNIDLLKSYKKFILPLASIQENILFFAALSQMIQIQKMNSKEKSERILELENKREKAGEQVIALEKSQTTSYEDKKILRGYYATLQQEATAEINELLNSFEVVEPQLIIHQPGLFDTSVNG